MKTHPSLRGRGTAAAVCSARIVFRAPHVGCCFIAIRIPAALKGGGIFHVRPSREAGGEVNESSGTDGDTETFGVQRITWQSIGGGGRHRSVVPFEIYGGCQ